MQRVVIIDYGSGNLHSAAKAFERAARESEANAQITLTADPDIVAAADCIVLPGVGAFADCKRGLEAVPGMRDVLEDTIRVKGRPFLGICVGMQLMASRGLEFEVTDGLDWIGGEVRAIEPNDKNLKIPHMGWNTLSIITPHALLQDIPTGPDGLHAYFVHSFHFVPKERSAVVAETDYGAPVTAFIAKDNMAGTQFHPEKSQTLGLKLIANFLKWRP
jgi:glutamine amidotransferase